MTISFIFRSLLRGQSSREVQLLFVRDFSLSSRINGSKQKKNGRRQIGSTSSVKDHHSSRDTITVSPSTIQVFSDPHLSQTVRNLAVSFQKSKNVIKNLRDDLEDCAFELLRQSQNNDTLETTVTETMKLLKQCNETDVPRLEANLKDLQENVVYFSKLVANQENKLSDMDENVQKALCKLSETSEKLAKMENNLETFRTESDNSRSEATAAFVETKIIRKELISLKGEINSLKKKSK